MVDFHSHILPRMDDGSGSVEDSLKMLSLYPDFITDVCLTPHFYPAREAPKDFLERRERSAQMLFSAVEGKKLPRLHLGAEIAYYEGIHNSAEIERFVLTGTRLLLVEMPMGEWSTRMMDELIDLNRSLGVRPVLAHVDRYSITSGNRAKMLDYFLMKRGLAQINVESLLSIMSRKRMISMLRHNAVHFIGSDAHNLSDRKPNFDSLESLFGKSKNSDLRDIAEGNERRFIDDFSIGHVGQTVGSTYPG